MSIAVDRPTSDPLLERLHQDTRNRVRAVMAAASNFALEIAKPDDLKMYKCVERNTTLSPHEHRRANQLKKCGSVPAVQVVPEKYVWRPLRRTELRVYVGINDQERLDPFVAEGRQRQIMRLTWDDLESAEYNDVLEEFEFLFALSPASRRTH